MLFRIEDTENIAGVKRQYTLSWDDLPRMYLSQVNDYIANEVRKEVNNTNDRQLLSYSKSLGVCLFKYNYYTDNELHISHTMPNDVYYYDCQKQMLKNCYYDIYQRDFGTKHKRNPQIILCNFSLDISDNVQLDYYLTQITGISKKKFASPEKDKEVVLMQEPNDLVISEYISSVYLLYALFYKYGIPPYVLKRLDNMITTLDNDRFRFCPESERQALLAVVKYLYNNGNREREFADKIILQGKDEARLSTYYDPNIQFYDIQDTTFEDSYKLSDYNHDIISSKIWGIYNDYFNIELPRRMFF